MALSYRNLIGHSKILCLYCDKEFSNARDQTKHGERDHKTFINKGGCRKSERITNKKSNLESPFYPGCFQCNKNASRTDNLDKLFNHLLSSHKDTYFGCKCKKRAHDKISLATHKKICKISSDKSSNLASKDIVTTSTHNNLKSVKINDNLKIDHTNESDLFSIRDKTPAQKKDHVNRFKNHSAIGNTSENPLKSIKSSSFNLKRDDSNIPLTRQKLKEPSRSITLKNKTDKKTKSMMSEDFKIISSLSPSNLQRFKTCKLVHSGSQNNQNEISESECVTSDFDEAFYKNISENIKHNLSSFVDGKIIQDNQIFDNLKASCTIGKQTLPMLQGRKIHEATSFKLSTPFPALLTVSQYGFADSNPNKNKRKITKNSWKWKWDLIKKFKYVSEGGKIVKKVKQITNGLKDLSQLDVWTQLRMRSRYENLCNYDRSEEIQSIKTIQQLNHILDKCLKPEINIEQSQQTVIKLEHNEKALLIEESEIMEIDGIVRTIIEPEILKMFNLMSSGECSIPNPTLSGEWARPRFFICLDCGMKFDLMKSLNEHKNSEHAYVLSSHYEIVGRENLEKKLYKNLFLPKKALQISGFARSLSFSSDSKSNEINETSNSSDNSVSFVADQKEKECSKCLKMIKFSSDNDIYRHILDCIEDRIWLQAKRRNKYRRSRRKSRKTPKKTRLVTDLKKLTTVPSAQIGGVNNISNISQPFEHHQQTTLQNKGITGKSEILCQNETRNDLNIKKFYRVSKTSNNQKSVIQKMDLLRNSLGSFFVENSEIETSKDDRTRLDYSDLRNIGKSVNKIFETPKETQAQNILKPFKILKLEETANHFRKSTNVKKKKLNDCIAMLTSKIEQKLGVNFFEKDLERFEDHKVTTNKEDTIELNSVTQRKKEKLSQSLIKSRLKECPSVLPAPNAAINLSLQKSKTYSADEELFPITSCDLGFQNVLQERETFIDPFEKEHQTLLVPTLKEEVSIESFNFSKLKNYEKKYAKGRFDLKKSETDERGNRENCKYGVRNSSSSSLKISIPVNRIPNLKEILSGHCQINLNNKYIKISESERQAFEEQKNRILNILNKTNSLTRKIASKRACTKNVTKCKKLEQNSKTNEKITAGIKSKHESEDKKTTAKLIDKKLKIEQAIKTSNRIRCRRLSVLVDPLSYQNRNSKIRLTNNSQQNGFCELLGTKDKIITERDRMSIMKDFQETSFFRHYSESSANIVASEKVVLKKTARLENEQKSKLDGQIVKFCDFSPKKPEKIHHATKSSNLVKSTLLPNDKIFNEELENRQRNCKRKLNIGNIITTSSKNMGTTKQPSENIGSPNDGYVQKNVPRKEKNKNQTQWRKKNCQRNLNCETICGISFPKKSNKRKSVDLESVSIAADDKMDSKKEFPQVISESLNQKNKEISTSIHGNAEELDRTISKSFDENFKLNNVEETLAKSYVYLKETHTGSNTLKEALSVKEISLTAENDGQRSVNLFTVNEDSFFNDELDNDNDKINDIVNDIINSSEFQNDDSERETKELYLSQSVAKKEAIRCVACKKTFRNHQIYLKHCTSNTHLMRIQGKIRGKGKEKNEDMNLEEHNFEIVKSDDKNINFELNEWKIFRTKGELKTFENFFAKNEDENLEKMNSHSQELKFDICQHVKGTTDENPFKSQTKSRPDNVKTKEKDQLFKTLFRTLKPNSKQHIESHLSCSSIKQKVDSQCFTNVPFEHAVKEKFPKKSSLTINRVKDTTVSIPTKSLIMGKIFKKNFERAENIFQPNSEKKFQQHIIENRIDEIFDHIKNSLAIDKVSALTSTETLIQVDSGAGSSSTIAYNDKIDKVSQPNNMHENNINGERRKKDFIKNIDTSETVEPSDSLGNVGKRKSSRRCAVKAKTFAETWSSDEYEELQKDTADILKIIDEIEKRECSKKRKPLKTENDLVKENNICDCDFYGNKINLKETTLKPIGLVPVRNFGSSISDSNRKSFKEKNFTDPFKSLSKDRVIVSDNQKLDDDSDTQTKSKFVVKRRRISCLGTSNTLYDLQQKTKTLDTNSDASKKFKKEKVFLYFEPKSIVLKTNDTKNAKEIQKAHSKKVQKHRKRPRNKVKNIAYDSDSDFEINLNKPNQVKPKRAQKIKASIIGEVSNFKKKEKHNLANDLLNKNSNEVKTLGSEKKQQDEKQNEMSKVTVAKDLNVSPNDETKKVPSASSNINSTNVRTKRNSSEKLYYWPSSSSESDQEQENIDEGSEALNQPEQHGWIVGDSHKKLVTLLAHAKIKNKIN